jgi:hypothetical protein
MDTELDVLAKVLVELLVGVLINRIHHIEDFVSLLLQSLEERRRLHSLLRFASDKVDSRLLIVHVRDIVLQRSHFIATLVGVVTQKLGKFGTVGRILMDAELDVLAKVLVELFLGVLVLGKVVEHFDALLDQEH